MELNKKKNVLQKYSVIHEINIILYIETSVSHIIIVEYMGEYSNIAYNCTIRSLGVAYSMKIRYNYGYENQ